MKRHILLSLLFSQKKNSVHGRVVVKNDLAGYIAEWHQSVNFHKVNSLVFHDGLPDEFIKEHTTEFVKFREVDSDIYNTCDVRWVVYNKFMQEEGHNYDYVFATDISDVIIGKTPWDDLDRYDKTVLFSGEDSHRYGSGWIQNRNNKLKNILPEVYLHIAENKKEKLVNPGIIGAASDTFKEYCQLMANLVIRGGPIPLTVDMSYHNYIVRTHFQSRVVHGEPINSIFRKFQKDRKDVWFIHK